MYFSSIHISTLTAALLIPITTATPITAPFVPKDEVLFTPENWVKINATGAVQRSINILSILSNQPNVAPDGFYQRFINLWYIGPIDKKDIICTDINAPEKCNVGQTRGKGGQYVDLFVGNPDDRTLPLVARAYENMYQNIAAMHSSVARAHDKINNDKFIDTIVQDIGRIDLPISRSTLFKLVKLSLSFIPTPAGPAASAAAAEIKSFATWVKRFKKFSKNASKDGQEINQQVEENEADQPATLRKAHDDAVNSFRQSLEEQFTEIFVNAHSDNFHVVLTDGGVQLGPNARLKPNDLQSAMEVNLKMYLLATFMNNINFLLLIDNLPSCERENGDVQDSNGKCRRLVLAEPGVIPTAVTVDRAKNINKINSYGLGITVSDVIQNALDCHGQGKTSADVDYSGLLDNPGSVTIPPCLFGFRVVDLTEKH